MKVEFVKLLLHPLQVFNEHHVIKTYGGVEV
jgi:hypothetical protein